LRGAWTGGRAVGAGPPQIGSRAALRPCRGRSGHPIRYTPGPGAGGGACE
jgi:hypothetical protein